MDINMDNQDVKNRNALFSIANEIKKFHLERNMRKNDKKYSNPIFDEFRLYKTSVKAKTKLLATLKKKLRIACVFAKMLLTIHAKKGINTYEVRQVTTVKHSTNPEFNSHNITHNLTYSKLIDMAYNQLCSNKDERRVPEIDKLKEIICLLNTTTTMLKQEKTKFENLERKYRFIASKLMLTENHLKNVINQNELSKKENLKLVKLINCQKDSELYPCPKLNSVLLNGQHNIKLYLSNMQSLLYEQTNSLKELGSLSKGNI